MACRLLAAATLLWVSSGYAHPSHSSYAEIEWSANALDVALKVLPEDIEQALSRVAGERIALVDTPTVRDLLQKYLASHIALALPAENLSDAQPLTTLTNVSLTFVGMQLDYRDTWLYFSLELAGAPGRPADYFLRNTLLNDVQPSQVNRVKRLWDTSAPTLVFTASEPTRPLRVSD